MTRTSASILASAQRRRRRKPDTHTHLRRQWQMSILNKTLSQSTSGWKWRPFVKVAGREVAGERNTVTTKLINFECKCHVMSSLQLSDLIALDTATPMQSTTLISSRSRICLTSGPIPAELGIYNIYVTYIWNLQKMAIQYIQAHNSFLTFL